jgi:sialic acid synthase SpsE|tara:strand:+ start:1246 stop:2076 length:831 start_codon:yes stop_codon:yes gene_type:complete
LVKNIFFKFQKPYIIAEAGINHNGNLKTAFDLVDVAKYNGADAVKFQTYDTKKRVGNVNKKIYEILKKCELSFDDFEKVNNYCKLKKITFFSTPFDEESVDFLEYLKVPLYKIASFDISNYQLINKIIKTKKPTIASTGMSSLSEIKKIYRLFRTKSVDLSILHCVSSYPNHERSSYLSNISFLKEKFKSPIGISDHTNDIKIPIYGTLLGAKIIEKHIKINDSHKCADSKVSITGKQLKLLRSEVDKISEILNKPKFGVRPEEIGIKIFKRKKIY